MVSVSETAGYWPVDHDVDRIELILWSRFRLRNGLIGIWLPHADNRTHEDWSPDASLVRDVPPVQVHGPGLCLCGSQIEHLHENGKGYRKVNVPTRHVDVEILNDERNSNDGSGNS